MEDGGGSWLTAWLTAAQLLHEQQKKQSSKKGSAHMHFIKQFMRRTSKGRRRQGKKEGHLT
jgi:hypothetical protein